MLSHTGWRGAAARFAILVAGLVAAVVLGSQGHAQPTDDVADTVFGQPDFVTAGCNTGGISASSACRPIYSAVDAAGRLWVSDSLNDRILVYLNPGTSDTVADYVLGQPDFVTAGCNTGGISATSLCKPNGLVWDSAGNLWVADTGNGRVLRLNDPLGTDFVADGVIGQPDFTSNACGGPLAVSICGPVGIATDASRNLWVTDFFSHRVLQYDTPLTSDATADRVFGQPDFTSSFCNNGGPSAVTLCFPSGLKVRADGTLFVADTVNNRVLQYNTPLTDAVADLAFGQPDVGTVTCNTGGISATSICRPVDLVFEGNGSMYVTDRDNARVLRYDAAPFNATADAVYGQGGSFTTGTCPSVTASSICYPYGISMDSTGALYVSDAYWVEAGYPTQYERVLRYSACPGGDADCDGFGDVAPTIHQGPANTNTARDNCIGLANPAQLNNDGNFIDLPTKPFDDLTRPASDAQGDACDVDADADRRPDADELTGFGCGGTITSPTNPDMDNDLVLDGAECFMGFNPLSFASRPTFTNCVALAPGDADGDGLPYAREYCNYATDDTLTNTDGDTCSDAKEVASINTDTTVSAIDLSQVAQSFGPSTGPNYIADFDFTRDLSISATDLSQVAQRFGPC